MLCAQPECCEPGLGTSNPQLSWCSPPQQWLKPPSVAVPVVSPFAILFVICSPCSHWHSWSWQWGWQWAGSQEVLQIGAGTAVGTARSVPHTHPQQG